jgi:exodeoxyribonuclease VII large subunit
MPRKKKILQATLWSSEGLGTHKASPTPVQGWDGFPAQRKRRKDKEFNNEKESGRIIFSVGDYLAYLEGLIGETEVVVQGEISGFKMHPVGAFFSLKDQEGEGLLRCYLPPRFLSQLGFGLEDGLLVQASGKASIYRPRGELSFTVSNVALVGDGSLRQAYEALKRKLELEGVFARKRSLPEFIHKIGLVTARTGEVIHDFEKNLRPLGFAVDLVSVRVQGNEAPSQIVQAIEAFNKNSGAEVLVVMRGGGSLEDLQAFNDERVARAIFRSEIPVICAIGHDRDVPIASLVADLYVSTPTMAAITINRSWDRLEQSLPLLKSELFYNFDEVLNGKRETVNIQMERLLFGIDRLLRVPGEFRERMRLEISNLEKRKVEIQTRISREIIAIVQSLKIRLRQIAAFVESRRAYLDGVSPEHNLRLGYSIVIGPKGQVVKRAGDLTIGECLSTLLAEGSFVSRVEDIKKQEHHDEQRKEE